MTKIVEAIDYNVFIGTDLFDHISEFLISNGYDKRKIFLLADENTMQHCLPILVDRVDCLKEVDVFEIESGEENKTLEICSHIWSALNEVNADRKSLLINLGGGVIGDMGGFIASTYKRGIDFLNIPTTLLSQVDASVGGKLGVDLDGVKNIIGVFNNPVAVFADTSFLETLDSREVKSGFAEVIKHGLIQDKSYFELLLNSDPSDLDWATIVHASVQIKNKVVLQDPKEAGLRKVLNFGHTIGHAVESYRLNTGNKLLHGEAIAVGMIAEAWLSVKFCDLSTKELDKITLFIKSYYPLDLISEESLDEIMKYMLHDKKNEGEAINFALLKCIGEASFDHVIGREDILKAITFYNSIV
jgi:3-dehydroquinate synthase